MRAHASVRKSDRPRRIDRYIDFFGGAEATRALTPGSGQRCAGTDLSSATKRVMGSPRRYPGWSDG